MKTLHRLFPQLFGLLIWGSRVAEHRRVMTSLGGMDDRELADIGLTRQDLRDVSALPLAADPTELLAVRADERAKLRLAYAGGPTADGSRIRESRARIAAE